MSSSFECPITLDEMSDPVIAADGYTYERSAIEQHFRTQGPRSPLSNEALSSTTLTPNRALKDLIAKKNEKKMSKESVTEVDDKPDKETSTLVATEDTKSFEDIISNTLAKVSQSSQMQYLRNLSESKKNEFLVMLTLFVCCLLWQPDQFVRIVLVMGMYFILRAIKLIDSSFAVQQQVSLVAAVIFLVALAWGPSHSLSSVSRFLILVITPQLLTELLGRVWPAMQDGMVNLEVFVCFVNLTTWQWHCSLILIAICAGVKNAFLRPKATGAFAVGWLCHMYFTVVVLLAGKLGPFNAVSTIMYVDFMANVCALAVLSEFPGGLRGLGLILLKNWFSVRPHLSWFAFSLTFLFSDKSLTAFFDSLFGSTFALPSSPAMLVQALPVSLFDLFDTRTLWQSWLVLFVKFCLDYLIWELLFQRKIAIGSFLPFEFVTQPRVGDVLMRVDSKWLVSKVVVQEWGEKSAAVRLTNGGDIIRLAEDSMRLPFLKEFLKDYDSGDFK